MTGYDRMRDNVDEWRARREAVTDAARRFLDVVRDPVARAVLDLHKPVDGLIGYDECHGCPAAGEHGDDYEPWPCPTTRTVAGVLGTPFPPPTGWADDPNFDPYAPFPGYVNDPSAPTTEGA